MTLANDYGQLLRYLESQNFKNVSSSPPKEKTVEQKKIEVSSSTKKMLEEASIDEFKNIPTTNKKYSKGFDVEQFESMMRSKLIEEYKTSQSYEKPYISCSELYNCLRQNYYVRKRYQTDIKQQFRFSYLYLIQKVGKHLHDLIQGLYNFEEAEKTVVSEKYKVKGRIDGIKGTTLYEIKTVEAGKFKNYSPEHYYQCLVYTYILNTEYGYKIDNITIVYVFRDLKRIQVYDLNVDLSLAKNFLERAPILLSCIENSSIIDPIGATEEQCKYCPYKEYCEKDGYKKVIQPYKKDKMEYKKEEAKDNKKEAVFLF